MGRRRVGIIGGETCLLLLVLLPVVMANTFLSSSTRNQMKSHLFKRLIPGVGYYKKYISHH